MLRRKVELAVVQALQNASVQQTVEILSVVINATLIPRPGKPYQPKAGQIVSGKVN